MVAIVVMVSRVMDLSRVEKGEKRVRRQESISSWMGMGILMLLEKKKKEG